MVIGWATEKRTRRAIFSRRNTLEMMATTSWTALMAMSLQSQCVPVLVRVRDGVPRRVFGEVGVGDLGAGRDSLPPGAHEGADAEGAGDGAQGAGDHRER